MDKKDALRHKTEGGCLFRVVSIVPGMALWFALLFLILKEIDASNLAWVIYIIYIPITFAGSIIGVYLDKKLSVVVDEMLKDEEMNRKVLKNDE